MQFLQRRVIPSPASLNNRIKTISIQRRKLHPLKELKRLRNISEFIHLVRLMAACKTVQDRPDRELLCLGAANPKSVFMLATL